eukprot:6205813-Pleurochrysis_carterae.AAC.1
MHIAIKLTDDSLAEMLSKCRTTTRRRPSCVASRKTSCARWALMLEEPHEPYSCTRQRHGRSSCAAPNGSAIAAQLPCAAERRQSGAKANGEPRDAIAIPVARQQKTARKVHSFVFSSIYYALPAATS